MTKTDGNPDSNRLQAGVSAEQLEAAVRKSGYPLQRVVAEELLRDFNVSEEWGYLDRESREHRALDVFGFRRLNDDTAGLWLSTAVLVECKRSGLTFVFFEAAASKVPREFPAVAGLHGKTPEINVAGVGSSSAPEAELLRLADLELVSHGPPVCSSFAKTEPKGKALDLSGTVLFNQFIFPLVSAERQVRRPSTVGRSRI
ncbi:MAG TPA: hypothetical protein VH988_21795 [Thermoanaerobaculia bacterium]|jgi:hypothetical protein|nr:hypothetical protein [Thermoanaerobaculia bacterium]